MTYFLCTYLLYISATLTFTTCIPQYSNPTITYLSPHLHQLLYTSPPSPSTGLTPTTPTTLFPSLPTCLSTYPSITTITLYHPRIPALLQPSQTTSVEESIKNPLLHHVSPIPDFFFYSNFICLGSKNNLFRMQLNKPPQLNPLVIINTTSLNKLMVCIH